jgi:hypothetical protein
MADDLADSLSAAKVALLSNVALLGQVDDADSLIGRNEILDVLPVCENQEFRPGVRLLLEAPDRFW